MLFLVNFLYFDMSVFVIVKTPGAQLVEHRAAMREVVSSTPAGPTLMVLK